MQDVEVARIKKFILRKDSQVWSVAVKLPFYFKTNYHLFLLEVPLIVNNDDITWDCAKETSVDEVTSDNDNGNIQSTKNATLHKQNLLKHWMKQLSVTSSSPKVLWRDTDSTARETYLVTMT